MENPLCTTKQETLIMGFKLRDLIEWHGCIASTNIWTIMIVWLIWRSIMIMKAISFFARKDTFVVSRVGFGMITAI